MNRKFIAFRSAASRDEAEIRGHRRTYIGSIPGRIVQALKQAGAMNPVFMLDESTGQRRLSGRPPAALLEVLDPRRTTRSGITTSRSTSISRACCSSRTRTSSARSTRPCWTGWKSFPSRGTARRKAPHREAVSGAAAARRERTVARAGNLRRRRARADHRRVHARGRRAEPRAKDWRGRAEDRGAGGGCRAGAARSKPRSGRIVRRSSG